jgi:hypothetical protein
MILVVLFIAGCEMLTDIETTYYYQSGGVSTGAYPLINTAGLSAQQALAYCNQYPVLGDKYSDVKSGYKRSQLEGDLNKINVPGFSKTQFLRILDTSGAVFQMFVLVNNDIIYYYVEKQ